MSSESVRVAVRVRPFNDRERERNAKCVIQMVGKTTRIVHPSDPDNTKVFSFDFSYWSHDGFKESTDGLLIADSPESPYADQQKVFEELGRDVLQNAVDGYNCSLFAYGQTGSGKSFSMVGYEKNKGIVPIISSELFTMIESTTSDSKKYAVSLSMVEIYNERVRDLLTKSSKNLEVRESPQSGFYVSGLEKVPVGSYKEIEKRMIQGTSNRTIAATQMNATSSRAHTVISVEFKQILAKEEGISTRSSTVNLIDLAGSERAESTGATGDRLKEGANINKSLSALGNVIAALADSSGGKKGVLVPYRDSVLTKMLKNALGGNSKTIMVAALSPADINYDETLSTLRYADRAKRIKNVAMVNENPLEKLIRDLREENERLKKMLNGEFPAEMDTRNLSDQEIEKMRREIEEDLRADMRDKSEMLELHDMTSWKEKIKAAESINASEEDVSLTAKKQRYPFLSNLNEDMQLSGVLLYFIDQDEVPIGKGSDGNGIKIGGPGVQNRHAVLLFNLETKMVIISPASIQCQVRVNGAKVSQEAELQDLDRIMLGGSNLYIFHNPLQPSDDQARYDWEYAQTEIAVADGFNTEDQGALEAQIIEVLPMVNELNAIAAEMNKEKKFAVLIIPQLAQDVLFGQEGKARVVVKMTSTRTQTSWIWERSHFITRRYIIQDLYRRFIEGEEQVYFIPENDPFWEPVADILVGHSYAFLQHLSYNLGMEHSLSVIDYKGREEGILSVAVYPCDNLGNVVDDDFADSMIDDPNELLNKPFYLKITVGKLTLYKSRFVHGSTVTFRVYRYHTLYYTSTIRGTLEPQFNYTTVVELPTITKDHLEYFQDGQLTFCVYGTQRDSDTTMPIPNNINHVESERQVRSGFDLSRQGTEVQVLKALNNQQRLKINKLKQLCIEWASKSAEAQNFDSFYRSVAALAFNSGGNKFRVVANIIGKSQVAINRLRRIGNGGTAVVEDSKTTNITISRKIGGKDVSEVCVTM